MVRYPMAFQESGLPTVQTFLHKIQSHKIAKLATFGSLPPDFVEIDFT